MPYGHHLADGPRHVERDGAERPELERRADAALGLDRDAGEARLELCECGVGVGVGVGMNEGEGEGEG